MNYELRITNYEYWNSFYQKYDNESPSLFAKFCLENFLNEKSSLIDLGCGNGRDSIYFMKNSCKVLGIDQSNSAIEYIKNKTEGFSDSQFIKGDFTKLEDIGTFNVVYSRFTLHSVSKVEQDKVLKFATKQLVKKGLFCIEVRGKKNELFGKGVRVVGEKDAYIFDDHYRRFLDFELLKNDLIDLGFVIEFSAEDKGFSPLEDKNETFIRVIARKP
jgi:tellurite methyltransferase